MVVRMEKRWRQWEVVELGGQWRKATVGAVAFIAMRPAKGDEGGDGGLGRARPAALYGCRCWQCGTGRSSGNSEHDMIGFQGAS
uniref:Uncharacterized protein n=1 Tax=Oryza punctata TaxID=4537 RepID=A0A0E0JKL4_ORYPU